MVTAEMAFASLGAVLACLALGWVLAVLALYVRCLDTAAEVARQAARADQAAVDRATADRPAGAVVTVHRRGDLVEVEVRLQAHPGLAWLPSVPLAVSATVLGEPS